jgi:hypothetical protein
VGGGGGLRHILYKLLARWVQQAFFDLQMPLRGPPALEREIEVQQRGAGRGGHVSSRILV